MKTTGCASLKTAGNVSGPNIIFQVCFLALGICFLDRFSQFISPFYSWRFPKSSQKMLEIRFLLMIEVFREFREMRTCDINVDP